jgi:hypothetical protein
MIEAQQRQLMAIYPGTGAGHFSQLTNQEFKVPARPAPSPQHSVGSTGAPITTGVTTGLATHIEESDQSEGSEDERLDLHPNPKDVDALGINSETESQRRDSPTRSIRSEMESPPKEDLAFKEAFKKGVNTLFELVPEAKGSSVIDAAIPKMKNTLTRLDKEPKEAPFRFKLHSMIRDAFLVTEHKLQAPDQYPWDPLKDPLSSGILKIDTFLQAGKRQSCYDIQDVRLEPRID